MPPRKAMGSVPPSGNPKVPVPPVRFDEIEGNSSSNKSLSQQGNGTKRKPVSTSRPVMKQGGGFTGFLTYFFIRITALYTIIAALFTCSTHPFSFDYSAKDSRSICRSLAQGKSHALPIVSPILRSAHQKLDPYTGPYVKAVKPYTQAIWKTTRPYYRQAEKQGRLVYNRHLEPMRKKAIKKGKLYTDPHVKTFNKHYKKQVQPHIDNFDKAVKPYQDVYTRDVAPYVSQAYSYSIAAGGASYTTYVNRVHPHVVASLQRLHAFYINHADPAMRRSYSLYVRPQVEKLLAKLFERKAHATASETIAEAKQEVKEAGKEGKLRSKEMQAEAKEEAIRKIEDPSLVERAQQATESFLGMAEEADDVEVARLDAELDAELEKVKEQLEAWESGMSKLVAQEYKLFTERVSDLRNRRLADLPDHFASLTESNVEDEVAASLTRLERVYKKLSKSDLSVSEQVQEANKQHSIQKQKLVQSQASLKQQIEMYANDLDKDEVKSLQASIAELRRYVKEAQKSFGKIMYEAKFERSVEDYEGWDTGMMKRVDFLEEDLQNLLKGGKVDKNMNAIDLRKEPKLDSHVVDLQSRVKKLYSTAISQLDSYATSGNLQLRGEGTLGAISDATDAVADQAKYLAEGAASSMLVAALAARKKLGLAPKETPGILERVQLCLQDATKSAASIVGAAPTQKSAGDYVESYVDSATSLAAAYGGYKTEPESYIEIIGDNAQKVMDAAAASVGDVAKGAGENYEAAISMAGDGFTAATTSAGNAYSAASSSVVSILPTEIPGSAGSEAVMSIVGVAQEQFASISKSASKVAETAGASVMGTGNKGVQQGSETIQGMYDSVKAGVESVGEAVSQGVESAKEAVVEVVGGEDPKLVGKNPMDKNYNTVGKAAEAIKDRIVHAEL